MANTSATLLEKNVEQALEKFEALLSTEGTKDLKKQWLETKTVLSFPTAAPTTIVPKGGPGGPSCQHGDC